MAMISATSWRRTVVETNGVANPYVFILLSPLFQCLFTFGAIVLFYIKLSHFYNESATLLAALCAAYFCATELSLQVNAAATTTEASAKRHASTTSRPSHNISRALAPKPSTSHAPWE
ncbi:hypothetical protein BX661DRAFT_205783 [Kickxella alabastrina]|uniref:uncharacterized protein n=1 Tax=Kickxella alabastrina TaxID=61397 RepID=UPI00222059D9|nr:uncharacterized protein BX661DRAFT_205783 [Kickxella alabastrina]KAI7826758.1 hypothetical protein BX661DRAFT_205783 [Kickxella alabastrina]